MGKSDLKLAAYKHSQNLGDMFKRKKLSAMPTLNHVSSTSAKVVDKSIDSSASTILRPEVNIDTATKEAAASTTLDVLPSVLEQGRQATNNTLITCSCWPTFSANLSE